MSTAAHQKATIASTNAGKRTMKAVRFHAFGGPEVLNYEDSPRPGIGTDEVLIRIHAAGVNPIDWKLRAGWFMKDQLRLPLIPGWDASGVIEGVGAGVTDLKTGDQVISRTVVGRDGTYAEYVAVPAAEVALKPKSVDHLHAAAVPIAGLTAWQALFEPSAIDLKSGQAILIHGAAGGVGTYAIQLARWRGARVLATASARNESFLLGLGVSQVIDYTRERFENVVKDVDAVLDTIGGDTQARSWGVIRPGGVMASIVGIGDTPAEAAARGIRGAAVFAQNSRAHLDQLSRAIDEGQMKPVLAEVLPLDQARKAHELIETGHVRGKLVLRTI